MIKKIFTIFCFVLVLTAFNAFCDTVSLKNGKKVEGTISERTDSSIKMNVEEVSITYYLDEVEEINGQKVKKQQEVIVKESVIAPEPQKNSIQKQDATKSQSVQPVAGSNLSQPDISGAKEQSSLVEEPKTLPPVGDKDIYGNLKIKPRDVKIALGIFAGIFLIFFIIAIVIYVYYSLCLYFIAKKTQKEPAWLSWIPIGNLFLMCKIAGLSYLWLLGLLIFFVPIIGIIGVFYNLGLFIYIWYKMAVARNKPGWLGILMIIPVVNFVIMGYLAFSE